MWVKTDAIAGNEPFYKNKYGAASPLIDETQK